MTDKELFDQYKRTAPVENVRFHLARPLPTELRADFTALLTKLYARPRGGQTPDMKREYERLVQRWREWRDNVARSYATKRRAA